MSITTTTMVEDEVKIFAEKEENPAQEIDLVERIHIIPSFDNLYDERQWAKEQMAGAFRVWAKLGYNDGAGGHISLRDPVQRDCFWISEFSR